jgi:hypothetical protein
MVNHSRRAALAMMRPSSLLIGGLVAVAVGANLQAHPAPAPSSTAQVAQRAAQPARAIWVGRESEMEAHLRNAEITSIENIGIGVTNPKRAHLKPPQPFESLVWKMLPPSWRTGYWESYKSEIAAYELDKLLQLKMVPPAIERTIEGETGAAIMWLPSIKSVQQSGGKVPTSPVWARAIRRMQLFDNFIGNPDRNGGNILIGRPGEFILIDHSRAFVTDQKLPWTFERVDAELWRRVTAVQRSDLDRVLGPWLDGKAIDAMLERRKRITAEVDRLVAQKGRALVIIE